MLRFLLGIPFIFGVLIWFSAGHVTEEQVDYDELIRAAAHKHGVRPSLVKAVIRKESSFKSKSVGAAGEVGLMQLMPGAVADWARVNHEKAPSRSKLFDPEVNVDIGTWYISNCQKHYAKYASRDILALAEYNAGYSRVKKWKPEDPSEPMDIEAIGIASTRKYVRTILSYQRAYAYLDD